MPMIRRNADPDRDHLVSQRTIALNILACVEEKLTEAALRLRRATPQRSRNMRP